MTARLVADVGNTRIKWGWCLLAEMRVAALPPDEPTAWTEQLREWRIDGPTEWAVAGVHPARCDQLCSWLKTQGAIVRVIADARELPLKIDVDAPERVGIDRLLNAVAAIARVPAGTASVVIDAGSAVTVDLVDEAGTFRGGAIAPGPRLMAKALHEYTAMLPLIDDFAEHDVPAKNTATAIRAGIFHTVCGGIDRLVDILMARHPAARILLAGGSTDLAAGLRCQPDVIGPALTLEGIRHTAWPKDSSTAVVAGGTP
jgi:type III pantothenate kinase